MVLDQFKIKYPHPKLLTISELHLLSVLNKRSFEQESMMGEEKGRTRSWL